MKQNDHQEPLIAKVRCSGAYLDYKPTKGIHRHTHHEILMIQKGGGVHSIDYVDYPVLDNQIFFLRPGQVHQFKPAPEAVFYFIAIDSEAVTLHSTVTLNQFEFFQSFNFRGYVQLKNIDRYIQLVKDIEREMTRKVQPHKSLIVASYLTILLVEMQREFLETRLSDQHQPYSDIVSSFNKLLDDETTMYRFVKDYASALFVSPNYLNECIKKETGRSASEWIAEKIELEAKRLLKQTSLSLKQVSSQLNFDNSTHFCRFFKKQSGVTPATFRKTRSMSMAPESLGHLHR